MEESEVATQKETVASTCVRDSAENQSNEATGEVSNPAAAAVCKPAEETGARFNRLKLLDKVMQKSLEKFIDIARYCDFFCVYGGKVSRTDVESRECSSSPSLSHVIDPQRYKCHYIILLHLATVVEKVFRSFTYNKNTPLQVKVLL